MSGTRPTGGQAPVPPSAPGAAGPSPAEVRASRLSAGNMLRSLAPLVAIVLALAAWLSFNHPDDDPVRTVDPSTTVASAARLASYALPVPTGLPDGYRPTSARTDAGAARQGDPVTLEIGYVTPKGQFAGFAVSDDPRAQALRTVLDGATDRGTVDIGGATWQRLETARGETAFSRQTGDGATVTVTGSASDAELTEVAASVRPYAG